MKAYPISFSDKESDRLKKQSEDLSDKVLSYLAVDASKCLEIGCGVGSNIPILRKFNDNLTYYGIDICSESINKAETIYSDNNTSFSVTKGEDLSSIEEYDLIVIRLVLWGTEKREKIIKNAYQALRKNGKLYCYEPDDQYLVFYPPLIQFEEMISQWQKTVLKKGCNPFIGRQLQSFLNNAGFSCLGMEVIIKTVVGRDRDKYLGTISNLYNIFSSNLSIENNSILNEIKSYDDNSFLSEGYVRAIGWKKDGK